MNITLYRVTISYCVMYVRYLGDGMRYLCHRRLDALTATYTWHANIGVERSLLSSALRVLWRMPDNGFEKRVTRHR